MKDNINAEDELLKILNNELTNSIDLEIGNILKNYVWTKSWKRKNSIEKVYKKIKISE